MSAVLIEETVRYEFWNKQIDSFFVYFHRILLYISDNLRLGLYYITFITFMEDNSCFKKYIGTPFSCEPNYCYQYPYLTFWYFTNLVIVFLPQNDFLFSKEWLRMDKIVIFLQNGHAFFHIFFNNYVKTQKGMQIMHYYFSKRFLRLNLNNFDSLQQWLRGGNFKCCAKILFEHSEN